MAVSVEAELVTRNKLSPRPSLRMRLVLASPVTGATATGPVPDRSTWESTLGGTALPDAGRGFSYGRSPSTGSRPGSLSGRSWDRKQSRLPRPNMASRPIPTGSLNANADYRATRRFGRPATILKSCGVVNCSSVTHPPVRQALQPFRSPRAIRLCRRPAERLGRLQSRHLWRHIV